MADKHDGKKGKGGGGDAPTVKSLIRSLLGSKAVSPLAGGGLKKEIRAASKLRYGPLENELSAQLRAQKATQQRNKAYYNDYLQRVRGIQQGTAGIYADANQQLSAAQQQATSSDSSILAALNGGRQDQAKLMGAAPSQGANPLAQAQVARSQAALGNQQRVIGQGATQQSYLADQRRIGQRQKIDTLIQGQDKAQSIRQQMEDLAREKGAFKVDMLRDLREGERGFLVDLLSGPNARKLAHIQGSEARKTDAANPSNSSGGGGGKKGGNKNRNESARARKDAKAILQSLSPPAGVSWQQIASRLRDEGVDPSLAKKLAKSWVHRHGGKGGGGNNGGGGGGGGNHQYGPGNHPGPR